MKFTKKAWFALLSLMCTASYSGVVRDKVSTTHDAVSHEIRALFKGQDEAN